MLHVAWRRHNSAGWDRGRARHLFAILAVGILLLIPFVVLFILACLYLREALVTLVFGAGLHFTLVLAVGYDILSSYAKSVAEAGDRAYRDTLRSGKVNNTSDRDALRDTAFVHGDVVRRAHVHVPEYFRAVAWTQGALVNLLVDAMILVIDVLEFYDGHEAHAASLQWIIALVVAWDVVLLLHALWLFLVVGRRLWLSRRDNDILLGSSDVAEADDDVDDYDIALDDAY